MRFGDGRRLGGLSLKKIAAEGAFHISCKFYISFWRKRLVQGVGEAGFARFPPKRETVPVKGRGGWLWRKRRSSDMTKVAGSGQARFPYAMFMRFSRESGVQTAIEVRGTPLCSMRSHGPQN